MKKKILSLIIAISFIPQFATADEGMWLPMFLNYDDMQAKGLKLTPEQIYDINNSSLKDAIVRLGRGFCTGEVISSQGLMLTNHHCGFGVIQENSTEEHNYLKDGFWAMKKSDELPAGFSVSFLVRMEDVTPKINAELNSEMTESERFAKISEISKAIENEATEDGKYSAQIRSFYKGNEFYMFIYETYNDVRLVGAPPSSIGKFGGDTDNWMWPRHTGDFTLFRIYANKDNQPADYAEDNIPYTPKHHLPVSLTGVEKGDYAMIFGYPGSTDRYLTSYGVKLATDKDQPARVKLRRKKLDLYEEGQAKSEKVNIQYASKHASVSNYWKYFIGQTKGLKRLKVYEKKKAQEDAFMEWVNKDNTRKEKYGEVMNLYAEAYKALDNIQLAQTYIGEAFFGIEILAFASRFSSLAAAIGTEKEAETIAQFKAQAKGHFKNYNDEIDKNVFAAMIKAYSEDLPDDQQAPYVKDLVKKYKNDYVKLAEVVFKKSVFSSEEKLNAFLDKPSAKMLEKDPAINMFTEGLNYYRTILGPQFAAANEKLSKAARLYVAGLREMNPDKAYFPDANSTMRVTYGNVLDYYPQDAVHYDYFTTLEGVMEKENPTVDEFVVEPKLKELYENKDYGRYAREDGKMQVCFISNNDITGGNSGSPVINAKGELIGTAFDGNWEAMSGDIAFEDEFQRTISVDIRYTLFIIDKFAGAGHLVEEMTLVKDKDVKAQKSSASEKEVEIKN